MGQNIALSSVFFMKFMNTAIDYINTIQYAGRYASAIASKVLRAALYSIGIAMYKTGHVHAESISTPTFGCGHISTVFDLDRPFVKRSGLCPRFNRKRPDMYTTKTRKTLPL